MAKQRIIDLPETKSEFKIRGEVSGVAKSKFFEKTQTKSGLDVHTMQFGIKTTSENNVFCDLRETKFDDVYFYKKSDVEGEKGTTKKVPYSQYKTFNEQGYNVLGMTNGLEQIMDDKGKTKNKLVTLPNYDAVKWLSENLGDEQPVFVLGKLDFSSYVGKNEDVVRATKFVPTKVLGTTALNFENDDFVETNAVKLGFIYMGIEKDDSDKNDIKFILSGKVVKYSSIEDIELVVRDSSLANKMRKGLKPYTYVDGFGYINSQAIEEEVEDTGWGTTDPFAKKFNTYIKEVVITGLNPDTFDTETYSEKAIEKALKAIADSKKAKEDFGATKEDTGWGTTAVDTSSDFDDEDWG